MAGDFLRITEIFHSVQGESTWAGLPCTFVRLTGCPLRCTWCDTEYAFHGGTRMTFEQILDAVHGHSAELVEVTGGEPLAHPGAFPLVDMLLEEVKKLREAMEARLEAGLASIEEAIRKGQVLGEEQARSLEKLHREAKEEIRRLTGELEEARRRLERLLAEARAAPKA